MNWVIRISILAALVLGLGSLLLRGVQSVRHEQQTRTMLLQIQAAVQDYHVDQERYVPREELTGSQLIGVLSDFGFLKELPINPWTRETWKLDGEEPDFLRYATDPNFETYALRALDPRTGEVLLEIDSVEQPSL
tara:strand:- start:10939 stop:11343 length:405 start_codon:yes stop_codon:yes gene_type:complete